MVRLKDTRKRIAAAESAEWVVPKFGFEIRHVQFADNCVPYSPVVGEATHARAHLTLVARPGSVVPYQPLREKRNLFLPFSKLRRADEIRAFASRNGFLGRPITGLGVLDGAKGPLVEAEPIALWRHEASQMDAVLKVMHRLPGRNRERGLFGKERRLPAQPTPPTHIDSLTWLLEEADRPRVVGIGDVRVGAQEHLAVMFIAGRINRYLSHLVPAQLSWQAKLSAFDFVLAPSSLLGMMWLQLANHLMLKREFRPCRVCRSPFEVATDSAGRGKSAMYCSNTCKQRAWQQRARTKPSRGR